MPEITRHVIEFGQAEVTAKIDFDAIPACGDGWNEPREPAHAEVTGVTLTLRTFRWRHTDKGLEKIATEKVVDCPAWLEELIIEDAQCDLDYAVDEELAFDADAAEAAAEARWEDRRTA